LRNERLVGGTKSCSHGEKRGAGDGTLLLSKKEDRGRDSAAMLDRRIKNVNFVQAAILGG